jgi:hypothetical protein
MTTHIHIEGLRYRILRTLSARKSARMYLTQRRKAQEVLRLASKPL